MPIEYLDESNAKKVSGRIEYLDKTPKEEMAERQVEAGLLGGTGEPMSREEAVKMSRRRMVERAMMEGDDRLLLLNEGTADERVGVKGQGWAPRAVAATVGGGFTSGPARLIQDGLVKAGAVSPEVVDALGIKRSAEENPGTVTAGNIVGNLAPAGKVFQGASAVGRVGKAALVGGGFGASESIAEGGAERLSENPGEILKDATVSAALSSILPGILESPAAGKLLVQKIATGKIKPDTEEILKAAKELEIPITPAQATGSRTLGLGERVLQNTPTSSGAMQARKEAVYEGLSKRASKLLDDNSPKVSEETFGQELQSRLLARQGKFKDTSSRLYDKFVQSVPEGLQIQLGRSRDLAQDFIEREGKKEGFGSSKLMTQLKTFIGEPDAAGVSVPKSTDVRTFLDIRAAVNDEINAAIKNERGDTARKLGLIKSQMDKSLEDFAKLQGGKIEDSFNLANSYYAKRAQTFNDPKIQRLIEKDPGKIYDIIAQPGTVKEIETLKKALGPNRFNPVKRAVMEKILATDGVDVFSPEKFGTSLGKFTPENIEAVFGKEKVQDIQKFWKVANAVVKNEKRVGNPSGTAQNVVSFLYTGGTVSSFMVGDPLTGSVVALTPPLLAKFYNSPGGMKLLTEAVQTPLGSPRASQLSARISALGTSEANKKRDIEDESPEKMRREILMDMEIKRRQKKLPNL